MNAVNAMLREQQEAAAPVTSADISALYDAKPLGRFGSKSVRRPVSEAIARANAEQERRP